jgi:hypothetical protein
MMTTIGLNLLVVFKIELFVSTALLTKNIEGLYHLVLGTEDINGVNVRSVKRLLISQQIMLRQINNN